MITANVSIGCSSDHWFGVVWIGNDLVATAIGSSPDDARRKVGHCVPRGVASHEVDPPPTHILDIINMLGDLENGIEECKQFSLSSAISLALRRILRVASSIPCGFVTTYGDIARTAGSEPRAVGRVMATNPLYPIVPCHRVVGSDMSLVGYGGRQDTSALSAKLARLDAEARDARKTRDVAVLDSVLSVYPVERVIEASLETAQRKKEAERQKAVELAADKIQLRLF